MWRRWFTRFYAFRALRTSRKLHDTWTSLWYSLHRSPSLTLHQSGRDFLGEPERFTIGELNDFARHAIDLSYFRYAQKDDGDVTRSESR